MPGEAGAVESVQNEDAMTAIPIRVLLLSGFLLASGAPLVSFWLWPINASMQNEVEQVEQRHLKIALNIRASLSQYAEELHATFEGVAPVLGAGGRPGLPPDLLRALHIFYLDAVDPATGLAADGAALSAADLARARNLAATRPGALSRGLPREGALPPRLMMARMIDGRLVVALVDTGYFQALTAAVRFGSDGHAVILDQEGHVLAHPREDWRETAQSLAGLGPVQRMRHGDSGVATFYSPALNAEVIAGFTQVPGPDWGVMVPQPLADLRANAHKVTRSVATVFLAGLALSALIAVWFSVHLGRAIRGVSRAANAMAAGQSGVRVPAEATWRVRELQELAASFNAMAERGEAAHAAITRMAEHDPLTGLLNRAAFFARADAAAQPGRQAVLYFIDLDGLKLCNDAVGHAGGDLMLRQVAAGLSMLAGPGDLAARQSGDEFVLLCFDRDAAAVAMLDRMLVTTLCRPLETATRRFEVSCSIGRADWACGTTSLRQLLRSADQAMYVSKQAGGGQVTVFDAAMSAAAAAAQDLRQALGRAIAEGAITGVFQPIFAVEDGRVIALEALARWQDPDRGEVSPAVFGAQAEEAGLIVDLGRQMRVQAFDMAAALKREGLGVPVQVNLSLLELVGGTLGAEVQAALAARGLEQADILFELTESRLEDRAQLARQEVVRLHGQGVRFAIDDFGKGQSSYERLLNFPFEQLKIDLQIAGPFERSDVAAGVIRAMAETGRVLGKQVVLECIDSAEALLRARRIGADGLQGFWLQPPLRATEVAEFLRRHARDVPGLRRALP